jgi:D-alanine-D-alanine ligase
MHILILHNAVSADGRPDEQDVLVQADAVAKDLLALGHRVETAGCDLNLSDLKHRLDDTRPSLAFNLVESLGGHGRLIHLVPAALEAWRIPFAGSGSAALWITTHKVLAKQRLVAAGLPTPAWIGPFPAEMPAVGDPTVPPADAAAHQWIVKSLWEHASFGLDDDGLLSGADPGAIDAVLRDRAPRLGGACFAEVFVDGREFNLSLLAGPAGPEVLPPAEIVFEDFGPHRPRIVGYRAKWAEESFEYRHTTRRFASNGGDGALLDELRQIALACWRVFDLRGWARVDFRVDAVGRPWILEVNANPCLAPDAGFAAAVAEAGITSAEAMARIVAEAM